GPFRVSDPACVVCSFASPSRGGRAMFLPNVCSGVLRRRTDRRAKPCRQLMRRPFRPMLETLEERVCLSTVGYSFTPIVDFMGSNLGAFSLPPTLNNVGTASFLASTSSGAMTILSGNGGTLRTIAVTGQSVPGGTLSFIGLDIHSINDSGTVPF